MVLVVVIFADNQAMYVLSGEEFLEFNSFCLSEDTSISLEYSEGGILVGVIVFVFLVLSFIVDLGRWR